MKIRTRLLCTLLVAVMAAFAGFASNAENSFTDVTKYSEAIDALYSVGVISGKTNTQYAPDDNVTRWQMALLVSKLVTGKPTSDWMEIPTSMQFTDVNMKEYGAHFPAAIYYASQKGIIKGVGGDLFDPDAGIKYQDGLIMALRALGYYTDSASVSSMAYPDDYIAKARALGLTAELADVNYTATLTRGQTAQVLYNAYTAKMANGSTISESVFGYEEDRIVLVATENLKIYSNAPFAKTGKLVFTTINPYGSLSSSCFELDASYVKNLFNTTDYNAYIGTSFNVKYRNNYAEIIEFAKNSTPSTVESGLSISSSLQNKITLNNTQYQTVSNYSERLIDKNVPTSHEIIIYAVNDAFTSGSVIIASQMSGTTAYYKLTTFDDNADGYPDRAIYKPYSFGVYTVTDGKINLAGNLTSSSVTIKNTTGTSLTSGVKVLYSYDSQTKELEIKKIYNETSGTVASYTAGSANVLITPSNYSSYTNFNLGNSELNGTVTPAKMKETLSGVAAGTQIKYITDESGNLIWFELAASTSTPGTTGTAYNSQMCVVNSYINGSLSGYSGGGQVNFYVSSIDGSASLYQSTLAIGDVVLMGAVTNTNNYYTLPVTNITSKPTYTTSNATASIQISNSTMCIYENGNIKFSMPIIGNVPYYTYITTTTGASSITQNYLTTSGATLGANMSVYVAKSDAGYVSMIYVRPASASSLVNNASAFTTVGYLATTTNYQSAPYNSQYPYVYTMTNMCANTVNAPILVNSATILPNTGYYRIVESNGTYYVNGNTPITTSQNGTNISVTIGTLKAQTVSPYTILSVGTATGIYASDFIVYRTGYSAGVFTEDTTNFKYSMNAAADKTMSLNSNVIVISLSPTTNNVGIGGLYSTVFTSKAIIIIL